jgi:hypothetical protein
MTTTKTKHGKHDKRDGSSGQFIRVALCDICGKGTGADYCTDDEVCQGSDGPGFYLCTRKRCGSKIEGLSIEQRREIYTKQRAANRASDL